MSTNFEDASDAMKFLFWDYWRALTPALNGGVVVSVRWQGVTYDGPPPVTKPYATHTIRHAKSQQITFGPPGQRRFLRPGVIAVQVFTPLANSQGLSLAEKLAIIARDAYEGKATTGGIWFRNARINEVGPDGTWYQQNMVVEFEYDEIK